MRCDDALGACSVSVVLQALQPLGVLIISNDPGGTGQVQGKAEYSCAAHERRGLIKPPCKVTAPCSSSNNPLEEYTCPSRCTTTHLPPPRACSSAAACVVLLPGAAQQSITSQPLLGFRAWAGMQLDLLCTKTQKEAGVELCGQ